MCVSEPLSAPLSSHATYAASVVPCLIVGRDFRACAFPEITPPIHQAVSLGLCTLFPGSLCPFTKPFGAFHLPSWPLVTPRIICAVSKFIFSICWAEFGSFVIPRTFCAVSEIALPVQWAFHSSQPAQKTSCRFSGYFVLLLSYFSPPPRQITALCLPRRPLEENRQSVLFPKSSSVP